MNMDTGEIVTFEDEKAREAFFRTAQSERFVPVKGKNLSNMEFTNKIVDNEEIRKVLIEISITRNLSRGVRRRLDKKLYKLRKKERRNVIQ